MERNYPGDKPISYKKQTAWQIIYNEYDKEEAEAVKLLNKEVSALITRIPQVYQLYVLPCQKEGTEILTNAFILGEYNKSALLQQFIKPEEVPHNGFCLKVIDRPDHEGCSLVLIAGDNKASIYYGVVEFLDDYLIQHYPYPYDNYFDLTLPKYSKSSAPAFERRRWWIWAHTITDYKAYLTNMARTRANELVIWTEYPPVNAKEFIDYAHNLGIKVIWGFAWGWVTNCSLLNDMTDESIAQLKKSIVEQYERDFAGIAQDGIYFQTFTERSNSDINGRNIARMVVPFVNEVAQELWSKYPTLHIEFGLHATSVMNDFDVIAQVDKRMEIVWEDGATFPIAYYPRVDKEEDFDNATQLVDKQLTLRGDPSLSNFIFKGCAIIDWSQFVHQTGPFVIGESGALITEHDTRIKERYWGVLQGEWTKYGKYAQKLAQQIHEQSNGKSCFAICGNFDGALWLPLALACNMMWDPYQDFADNLRPTMAKPSVHKV